MLRSGVFVAGVRRRSPLPLPEQSSSSPDLTGIQAGSRRQFESEISMSMSACNHFTAKIAVLAAAFALLTGCATTGSLSDASSRLERSAEALYDEVRDNGDLRREAQALARAARDFNDEVRDGAGRDELRREFDDVAERYHDLRDEYSDQRPTSGSRSAFADVTRAYLDVERELQYRRVADSRD
jgi:hypothetical protein